MARVSNPSRPVSRANGVVALNRTAPGVTPISVPLEGEQYAHEPVRARYEREAEELQRYWRHLVGEMRVVDNRLEELGSLLS